MRIWFALFVVLAGISSPTVANAQKASTNHGGALGIPLTSERLLFAPPQNFYKTYHSDLIGSTTEFVPGAENKEVWTEMITIQIFRGLQTEPAPFLQTIGHRLIEACPKISSPKGIVTGQANGFVTSMLIVRCPLNSTTGKPETTVFRVIKGNDALYAIQHAWRSMASDEKLEAAVLSLRSATVCDGSSPNHPCPSIKDLGSAARRE